MTGEPMTARGAVAGRAPHLQPPHANHPLQALRTDDIEVQVLEQGIELCTSERKTSFYSLWLIVVARKVANLAD
uniref:Uncharacterized protein n=1 Tax=Anopheles minimus TaxID=112268 RepID=A0A182VY60_9DIPT